MPALESAEAAKATIRARNRWPPHDDVQRPSRRPGPLGRAANGDTEEKRGNGAAGLFRLFRGRLALPAVLRRPQALRSARPSVAGALEVPPPDGREPRKHQDAQRTRRIRDNYLAIRLPRCRPKRWARRQLSWPKFCNCHNFRARLFWPISNTSTDHHEAVARPPCHLR